MGQNNYQGNKRRDDPDIEINNTSRPSFWQNPQFTFFLYLLFIVLSFQFWQKNAENKQLEIPYSQFLDYVERYGDWGTETFYYRSALESGDG